MRAALFLFAAVLVQAAPVTLNYRAQITGLQEGTPVEVGDRVEMSVTYESTVAGFLYDSASWAYPIVSASVRVGDDVLTADFSGKVISYVIITNDYQDTNGESYMDQFLVQIGSTPDSAVTFVALILRNGSDSPSPLLQSNALPAIGPNPAQFNGPAFFAVFYGSREAGTGLPELASAQTAPEPGSLLLCGLSLIPLSFCRIAKSCATCRHRGARR